MASRTRPRHHLAGLLLFTFCIAASAQNSTTSNRTFTLYNNCNETIWPGIITKADHNNDSAAAAGNVGFPLQPGQTASYPAPPGWSGRIWGRTGCGFTANNGTGTCQTGSCGTSLNCTAPSSPPNTIVEFTLGDELDFYDVSLVDGFNVAVVVSPFNGKGNCSVAGCDGDLRQSCPSELAVKYGDNVVACRSACEVFDSDEYCCRGKYSDPMVCVASNYSRTFKQVCPAASSYALDDRSAVMTCSASDYLIAFCSSRNQTLCSYKDDKVVCSSSNSTGSSSNNPKFRLLTSAWWLPMVAWMMMRFCM